MERYLVKDDPAVSAIGPFGWEPGESNGVDDDLLATVGLIYEAALNPELWPAVLQRITDLSGGVYTALFVAEPTTGRLIHDLASKFPDRGVYLAHYARMDPRNAHGMRQPAGTKFTDYDFTTEAEIARSEFYQDYLIPHGMGYVGARMLKNDRCGVAAVAIQRARRQGPFEPRELDLLDRLASHLLRALRLQTRFAELDAGRWADCTLRDRLPFGVVFLDNCDRIVSLNQTASALLAAGSGLTARHGRLRAALSADQAALDKLIRDAASTAEGAAAEGGGAMTLHRRSLRRPLSVLVMPIPRRGVSLTLDVAASRPTVAVIITDPEAAPGPIEDRLRRLYRLTPAEAALARALAAGKGLYEYAGEAGITAETARTHLKRILTKTETTRQAELVRLILGAIPML